MTTPWLDDAGNWTLEGMMLFVRAKRRGFPEGGLLMRITECRGPMATAVGYVHGKPYLVDDMGLPMRKEDVILGISGLPCNAGIAEPVTTFEITFDGHYATRNEVTGELEVDASRPDVKVEAREVNR